MPLTRISGLFIAPPISIARLGASPTPMESFGWVEDAAQFGAGQTMIRPEPSIEVSSNGSQTVYVPAQIRFRDGDLIRPVCPFLELWCYVTEGESNVPVLQPLTIDMLREHEATLANVTWEVIAVNRKAARRTGDENCAYSASLTVSASDFTPRRLLASSPNAGGTPLVHPENPIPLGVFQPARPVARRKDGMHIRYGVDLRILRVRFTPATGQVYGPPSTMAAADPATERVYELTPSSNRFTNPAASWNFHDQQKSNETDTPPQPTYDGEADLARKGRSFGVVDDTSEVLVTARLAWNGQCFESTARIFVGPPDFAPDRRPFYSLADEFADRDPASFPEPADDPISAQGFVFDLFRRIYETAMLINVDRYRLRVISPESKQVAGLPLTGDYSMRKRAVGETGKDDSVFLSPEAKDRLVDPINEDSRPKQNRFLVRAELARDRHEVMSDPQALVDEILDKTGLIPSIIRPPYKKVSELTPKPLDPAAVNEWRDIRVDRDGAHDMRMPPYMRDSDTTALSLTCRQYRLVLQFIENLRSGIFATPAEVHRERVLKRRRNSVERRERQAP
jgi:hypothetical protein